MKTEKNFFSQRFYFFTRMNLFLKASIYFTFISIIILLLIELARKYLYSDIWQVLMVVLGMTLMASLTYFHTYLLTEKKSYLVKEISENKYEESESLYLNEEFIKQNLDAAFKKIIDEEYLIKNRNERNYLEQDPQSWVITANSLVGKDNSLALAKLRIDIESELGKLALTHNIDFSNKGNIYNLAKVLTTNKVLPAESLLPLNDVIEVCNRGIHGIEISNEETQKAINLGYEMIDRINSLRN